MGEEEQGIVEKAVKAGRRVLTGVKEVVDLTSGQRKVEKAAARRIEKKPRLTLLPEWSPEELEKLEKKRALKERRSGLVISEGRAEEDKLVGSPRFLERKRHSRLLFLKERLEKGQLARQEEEELVVLTIEQLEAQIERELSPDEKDQVRRGLLGEASGNNKKSV